jgi:hypothetical protein
MNSYTPLWRFVFGCIVWALSLPLLPLLWAYYIVAAGVVAAWQEWRWLSLRVEIKEWLSIGREIRASLVEWRSRVFGAASKGGGKP